jgi:5-aminolevulinate synthase
VPPAAPNKSGATMTFQHLAQLLAHAASGRPKLIVFESVYSMDGDVAPLEAICDLAAR